MRKVIGIGETILDILFHDGQPQAAVPGGSIYNAVISLGRMGQNVTFISETKRPCGRDDSWQTCAKTELIRQM